MWFARIEEVCEPDFRIENYRREVPEEENSPVHFILGLRKGLR